MLKQNIPPAAWHWNSPTGSSRPVPEMTLLEPAKRMCQFIFQLLENLIWELAYVFCSCQACLRVARFRVNSGRNQRTSLASHTTLNPLEASKKILLWLLINDLIHVYFNTLCHQPVISALVPEMMVIMELTRRLILHLCRMQTAEKKRRFPDTTSGNHALHN